ncbi:hypothetical protein HDU88_003271 [Geranomyces variabilis]|nr:hypothetical protein HDU88_003271 [Geranomyces variabilis]
MRAGKKVIDGATFDNLVNGHRVTYQPRKLTTGVYKGIKTSLPAKVTDNDNTSHTYGFTFARNDLDSGAEYCFQFSKEPEGLLLKDERNGKVIRHFLRADLKTN